MDQAWTQNQLNVLQSTLIDQERINSGDLQAGEQRLVDITTALEKYLVARYPDHSFVLLGLKDVFFQADTLSFRAVDEQGHEFHMVATAKQADLNDLTFTDGYYPIMMDTQVKQYTLQLLENAGIPGGKTTVWIYGAFNDAYNPALSIEDSIAEGHAFQVSGNIFLSKGNVPSVSAEELTNALSGKGLTGTLSVWIMDVLPEGNAAATWIKDYCKLQNIQAINISIK